MYFELSDMHMSLCIKIKQN